MILEIGTTETGTSLITAIFQSENLFITITLIVVFGFIWTFYRKYREKIPKKMQWLAGGISFIIGIILFFLSASQTSPIVQFLSILLIIFGVFMAPLRKITFNFDSESKAERKEYLRQEDADYYKKKVAAQLRLGHIWYDGKKYMKSIDCFVEVIKYEETNTEAWFMLGEINFDRDRFKQAGKCYKQVLDIDARYPNAREKLDQVISILKPQKENSDSK